MSANELLYKFLTTIYYKQVGSCTITIIWLNLELQATYFEDRFGGIMFFEGRAIGFWCQWLGFNGMGNARDGTTDFDQKK